MFGLFKKKKQQTEALIEKDEHSSSDNGAADIAARTASNQATQIQMQKAAQTFAKPSQTSVYKGYKRDKIEMRGDRAEISDFPLYLNTVAGGLDCRDQTIGGFSFVVKIYAVPVVEIIG